MRNDDRVTIINGVRIRDITPERTSEEVKEVAKALLDYGKEQKNKRKNSQQEKK